MTKMAEVTILVTNKAFIQRGQRRRSSARRAQRRTGHDGSNGCACVCVRGVVGCILPHHPLPSRDPVALLHETSHANTHHKNHPVKLSPAFSIQVHFHKPLAPSFTAVYFFPKPPSGFNLLLRVPSAALPLNTIYNSAMLYRMVLIKFA